ncbi:MAG: response regulator transcription factor [Flavobacteriales bacterium]|nr:response regulator transcription factor [Flavobacteriales bacterium]MEB2342404.1 LytTR family DNA-binding domain-containing protein [Flavobacteriia bacterium]
MLSAIVVDDEPGNREYLKVLLREHAGDVEVVGEAGNIAEAKAFLEHRPVDLLFLDVEMPGGSGFDLLRGMGSWPFEVIFTTAFSRYAIQAIRFSALDYLLKPVQPEELRSALDRCIAQRAQALPREELQKQFMANIAKDEEKDLKLSLTSGDRNYFVSPKAVSLCQADGNYTELHLDDGRRFISARTLKEYEDMLEPWGFLRVHRASLVNRAAVAGITDGQVVLKDGRRVEVSRRRWEEVRRIFKP